MKSPLALKVSYKTLASLETNDTKRTINKSCLRKKNFIVFDDYRAVTATTTSKPNPKKINTNIISSLKENNSILYKSYYSHIKLNGN